MLANKLTILRIVLSPLIILLLIKSFYLMALVVFAIAAFTDYLDGFLARKFNQCSQLGALLDPIADKALTMPLLIYFAAHGLMNNYLVYLLIARDLSLTFMRLRQASEPSNQASIWGKIKTVLLYSAIVLSFFLTISNNIEPQVIYIIKIAIDTVLFLSLIFSLMGLVKHLKFKT